MMRSQPLDILRAVAILLVLGQHAFVDAEDTGGVPAVVVRAWQTGGWTGVDLFFVLSGFLVSGLLFKEYMVHGDVWLGRFLIRRGFKIYPAFYAFLLLMLLPALIGGQVIDWRPLACEGLFVQNYGPNQFGHTWSLAVEEHFYLLLCLFFAIRLRHPQPRPFAMLPTVFVLVAGATLALRLAMVHYPFSTKTHLCPTHLRLDALSFGVLLSYLYHFHQNGLARLVRTRRLPLLFLGLCLVSPCFHSEVHATAYGHMVVLTLEYVGWGCVLLAALYWQPSRAPLRRRAFGILAAIGFYSYSIYVWHMTVQTRLYAIIVSARHGAPVSYPVALTIYIVSAVLVGIVMAKLIEGPFLRLRDRWFPSRGKALTFVGASAPSPA
jgi:peptidoglycan/LPS O-acetylase OafA/YrhL